MNRAIPAVMAGLLCGVAGLRRASQLRADARRLQRWAELMPVLALILSEGAVSIPRALTLSATGAGIPDELLRAAADAINANPSASLAEVFSQLLPPDPEKETLMRMAAALGHGSKQSRCLTVEQTAALLTRQAEAAERTSTHDARLWQTLGWTCGACLTLLLI